jgi:hypothetical protein
MLALRLLLTVTFFSTALPALAAPAESPEAFVRRVYARYARDKGPGVSTERPAGTPYFAAPLLDAFAKDQELAHGEVGAIDADPVCDCQDWGKLRVKQVAVTPGQGGAVLARVTFTNFGKPQTLTLTLADTPDGWRIADIGSKDIKSLKAFLDESNAHPVTDTPADSSKPPAK